MADDHSQPVADQIIPPVNPSIPATPIQVQTPDLTSQSEASSSAHRPETPIPADERLADEKESTESASLDQVQTSEDHRPDSPKLADEEKAASEAPELADKQSEATASSQVETEVKVEEKPVETVSEKVDQSADLPAEVETKEGVLTSQDTDVKPPDNQTSQVQSGPFDNTSSNQLEKPKEEMAEIKPEPLESLKMAESKENIPDDLFEIKDTPQETVSSP